MPKEIIVVGGGAAGYFAAISAAQSGGNHVTIYERSKQPLTKVRISGGGRCNVTHACFDPAQLIKNYPRGGKALLGAFHRFQPRDTIQWFKNCGVELKVEEDGRMFPITDDSATIVNCLQQEAHQAGVNVKLGATVDSIARHDKRFTLQLGSGTHVDCDRLILTTGSSPKAWEWLKTLGHQISPPIPSLFTFNTPSSPLLELAGITVSDVIAKIAGSSLEQRGPLLLTHWGFSGPAILKLSAWGARYLHEQNYQSTLLIDWLPEMNEEQLRGELRMIKDHSPARQIANEGISSLPKNLWKAFLDKCEITKEQRWSSITRQQLQSLVMELKKGAYEVKGKSQYKDEFVTCGGVILNEVDFRTMQSKICPHLYFAGEILDIDGVTGGFNFQNAWTTGLIAGQSSVLDS